MRVLVIEDHIDYADVIARGLRRAGMAVDVAHDGVTGWEKASVYDYDVVLLDRDLPRMHGDELCRRLRDGGAGARVLMLTAAAGAGQVATGLSLGADDYLAKPFEFVELEARIRALARRPDRADAPVLEAAGIRVDCSSRVVTRDGRPVDLTPKELGVLETLIASGARVTSAEELLARVWDENADPFTTTVRTTIGRLRRKLGRPDPIETVTGSGYRIRR
ncbi:MAG: response regulator transcription factor [Actinobacteria bacterium]|nr:response regulator transcription factor [Actinomycetota bacterium]